MTALSASTRPDAHPDETRRRILDAAEQVFAAHGYRGATTREIADAAGIGKRMLFYYFPTKDAVYRAVLERIVENMIAVHERFRDEPAPIGLGDAVEGITQLAAANLSAVKVLVREIVDDGPYVAEFTERYWRPLYAAAGEEIARNMRDGVFRPHDPVDVLVNVGGVTLFYFLVLPMLTRVSRRDPLAPATLAARAAAARECLVRGLAAGPDPKEGAS